MLQYENIKLRPLEPNDIDKLLEWENDSENWQVSNTLVPFSRAVMEAYIFSAQDIFSNRQIRFIIEEESLGVPLGCIDLFDYEPMHRRAGVGILIDKKHRSKGVAGKALKIIKEYSKEVLHLKQLYCNINQENEYSLKLFMSQGFKQTGVKKEWVFDGEKWTDELFFQYITK